MLLVTLIDYAYCCLRHAAFGAAPCLMLYAAITLPLPLPLLHYAIRLITLPPDIDYYAIFITLIFAITPLLFRC